MFYAIKSGEHLAKGRLNPQKRCKIVLNAIGGFLDFAPIER